MSSGLKHILLVDDEPRVLDGLRRSLHDMRGVWSITYAASGAAALEALAERPFDVVVSDMRMPGMDGAELLRRVARARPEAARIVLSGQMDEQVATRAAGVAHRFLAKPCEPEVLKATLARALELQECLGSDELRRCITSMVALPSLPSACVAIDRAVADERNTLRDVVEAIECDVGMAAKVLQLVNSAFFGLSRKVNDIHEAVRFLGLNTIRALVLAESLFQVFDVDDILDAKGVLEHSLVASRVARLLVDDPRAAEVAATGALLHDAGALALATQLPDVYRASLEEASARALPLHVVERERLGVTHADVGAHLLGLWGLPHEVLDVVARHHDPLPTSGPLDVGGAVRVALALTDATSVCAEPAGPSAVVSPALVEQLGLGTKVTSIVATWPYLFRLGAAS